MHDPSSRPSELPRPFTDGEDGAPGSSAAPGFVGFGSFRFRASDPFLLRDGEEIALPPRAFEVLKLLLGRPGQVVSKRDLLERAWSDAVVGDNALTQTISQLREILGDDAEDPRFIQTVPRQGYRFIAEVERLEGSDGAPVRGSRGSNEHGGGVSPGRLAAASFLAVGGFVLGVIVAIVLGLGAARGPEQVAPKRFVIELPEGAPLVLSVPAPLDISADGNRIVYTGGSRERWNLYTKRLDETAWHTLSGTEGAYYPVFSPDGRWIAYVAETRRDGSVAGEVRKVPSDGGPPVVVGAHSYDDLPDYSRKSRWQRHLTWEPDGWIYFDDGHSIWRIRPSGGEAVLVARPPLVRLQYRWAQLLPGRERILFQAKHFGPGGALEDRDVRVQRITPGEGGADGAAEILIRGMYFFRWVPSGHLLTYDIKGHGDAMYGVMYAQRFDPGTLALGERRVPVLEIWNDFALSASGTLAYFSLDAQPKQSGRFQWFDREGTVADTWHPGAGVDCWPAHGELSFDGSRLVTNCYEWGDGSTLDVWIVDLDSGLRTRLTKPGRDFSPVWSPSGDRIAYSSERDGRWKLVSVDVDRPGEPTVLLESDEPLFPQAWSDDGGSLVYVRVEGGE
ncbi:MAG: winged helix-turn-helix domain-containing protein, partial [Thermoanaerobaculia bacterium]|nr:winged helix-turn-helix domain-containing protein [Thermoanaerobaculia bacterium]